MARKSTTTVKKRTTTAKRASTPKAASTPKPKTEQGVRQDLFDAILDEVKAVLVREPKLRWNAKKTYASLLVEDKLNIAYLFAPTKKGVRVEPAASPADLPSAVKGFKASGRSARFDLVTVVGDPAGVKHAAAAIKVAYEKATREESGRTNGKRLAEDVQESAAAAAATS